MAAKHLLLSDAVNVSVPEEMDGRLTKSIIEEYGLKASASMVRACTFAKYQVFLRNL